MKETQDELPDKLKSWMRLASRRKGVKWKGFVSGVDKVQNTYIDIPTGLGMFTPLNRLMREKPENI